MTLKESWFNTIKKTIKLAKNAGFCYGVKRAVDTTKKIKQDNPLKTVSVLGELIHNSHVTNELESLGINTLSTLPEKGDGICIIRSHGESDDTFNEIQSKGFEIVDLTCLDVKKVQQKAVELVCNGYFVIILGKYDHPEVSAIYTNAKNQSNDANNVFVAQNLEALKGIEPRIKKAAKVGIVLQTTQTKEFLIEVISYLSQICKILKVQNTICPSTTLRQEEAKKLGKESDLMVVVGSKKSANTTHLAQILESITDTIHIEHQDELQNFQDKIKKAQNIGVTAGASTPDSIINKVINKLENIN